VLEISSPIYDLKGQVVFKLCSGRGVVDIGNAIIDNRMLGVAL
jgi:hypothetical protein